MSVCKIVVFEGADKSGKETQSKLLQQTLCDAGYNAMRIEVPSKLCPRTHSLIYRMLHNGWAKRVPNAFQFVQFLNKWLFQVRVLPALEVHADVVIFDRWSLSAIVYGNATGVNRTFNDFLYHRLRRPDATLVFYGKSYKRNTTDDSYEKDTELQAKVKHGYYDWVATHPDDHVLVDNTHSIEQVHKDVVWHLAARDIP